MTWFGYAPAQWALFFFLYSFLGWVWESCYVSLRQGRWVNRGFLNGPLLPIYGFGAVAILLFTLPVAANPLLVFLMGMTGATLLEYVTGWTMERLFHVRYWDYSMYRFNLNGYICLPASLCWGAFSLVMLRLIHPVVSGWVAMLAPGGLVRGIETAQSRLQALRQQRRQLLRTLSVEASGDVDAARLVREELSAMEGRTDSMYRRALRHLRRNPGAVSRRCAEGLRDMEPLLRP